MTHYTVVRATFFELSYTDLTCVLAYRLPKNILSGKGQATSLIKFWKPSQKNKRRSYNRFYISERYRFLFYS